MADFCKECAKDLFNADTNDLSGIISKADSDAGYVSSVVICEGCGPIQVDHEGSCKSEDCIGDHRMGGRTVSAVSVSDGLEYGDPGYMPMLTPHAADIERMLDADDALGLNVPGNKQMLIEAETSIENALIADDETHCGPACVDCDCDTESDHEDRCTDCGSTDIDCVCEQDNHCDECCLLLEDCECDTESEQDSVCYECDMPHEDCECADCHECDNPVDACTCHECMTCGEEHAHCECNKGDLV